MDEPLKQPEPVDSLDNHATNDYGNPIDMRNHNKLTAFLEVQQLDGQMPTLDVELQIQHPSTGKWVNSMDCFRQQTTSGTDILDVESVGSRCRFKYVLGGENPTVSLELGVVKEKVLELRVPEEVHLV